ncbi:hypothetical protein JG687_00019660 [Phytophthora cactorum]|uniref:Uncharacterized protein n=1 Tax=Phytophthora cactorum TaxID=29920 RepID=A0A8T1TLE5_9STRA|nr:hypothetical protein GQ600_7534 [Phytophthora cactorum]KAG6941425.1 hypothetical protein JG687_00019660 [Phytophthora cactorum]
MDGARHVVRKEDIAHAEHHWLSFPDAGSARSALHSPSSGRLSSYSCIELLVEAKADTTSVYNYIRENSKHRVTMDVARNLIERLKN